MRSFNYKKVDDGLYWRKIDEFVTKYGDDRFGRIPDDDFERLFDLAVMKLQGFGEFLEDVMCRNGAFASSRYVEPISAFNIVVGVQMSPQRLAEVGMDIVGTAQRSLCISFDCEGGSIAVFPGGVVVGTFCEEQLDVPLPFRK